MDVSMVLKIPVLLSSLTSNFIYIMCSSNKEKQTKQNKIPILSMARILI